MYQTGDLVLYGNSGVCRMEEIAARDFGSGVRTYYQLRPLHAHGDAAIFIPTDNEALVQALQPLLSADALLSLCQSISPLTEADCPPDARSRAKRYREMLASGDRNTLICLVKTLAPFCTPAEAPQGSGGKGAGRYEELLDRAVAMLYEEFSQAFVLTLNDMVPLILLQTIPPRRQA